MFSAGRTGDLILSGKSVTIRKNGRGGNKMLLNIIEALRQWDSRKQATKA